MNKLADRQEELADSQRQILDALAENTRKTDQILKGFPQNDPYGHCRYHEEVMQQMADRRKMRQDVMTHLLKTSSWGALVGILWVLWKYFKQQING